MRGATTVLTGTSLKDISSNCVCGIYNFNAYVGTLPPGPADPLGADGLSHFTQGLSGGCAAQPSLGQPVNTPGTTVTSSTTSAPPPASSTTTAPPPPPPTTTTSQGGTPTSSGVCIGGTVAPGMSGNYMGLCSYCCNYGYCPPGPCVCTAYGAPVPTQPVTGQQGCPAIGLDDSYKGLCSFTCNHGYCPEGACRLC
jgi:hypothetical protein